MDGQLIGFLNPRTIKSVKIVETENDMYFVTAVRGEPLAANIVPEPVSGEEAFGIARDVARTLG